MLLLLHLVQALLQLLVSCQLVLGLALPQRVVGLALCMGVLRLTLRQLVLDQLRCVLGLGGRLLGKML